MVGKDPLAIGDSDQRSESDLQREDLQPTDKSVSVHRDDVARIILEVATDLFVQRGYAGTKISEISEISGVSRGSLAWRYATKADLFAAVLENSLEPLREGLASSARLGPGSNAEAATVWVKTTRYGMEDGARLRLILIAMAEAITHGGPAQEKLGELFREINHQTVASLERPGVRLPEGLSARGLNSLRAALSVGISIQYAVAPDLFDLDELFGDLESIARRAVDASP